MNFHKELLFTTSPLTGQERGLPLPALIKPSRSIYASRNSGKKRAPFESKELQSGNSSGLTPNMEQSWQLAPLITR